MSFRSLSAFALVFALAVPMAAQVPTPVVAPELAKAGDETTEPSNGRSTLRTDNFQSPKQAEQAKLRNEALKQRLSGKGAGRVQQVAAGQYVDFQVQRNDRVFVLLVEYGDKAPVNAPEPAVQISQAAGPLHNQIPEPDRAQDNSTIWQKNYD